MPEKLPILCSAHHASADFGKFSDRCALTAQQKMRYSDYGTAETVPRKNLQKPIVATHSRALVDINRGLIGGVLFAEKDFENPPNRIWKPGQEPTASERGRFLTKIYAPYDKKIMSTIRSFDRPGVIVAWDNTADKIIGKNEEGEKVQMPSFILSNMGAEGKTDVSDKDRAEGKVTTCDPGFLDVFANDLRQSLAKCGLPTDIFFNLVFKGGKGIARRFSTHIRPELDVSVDVQTFQVEYNTRFTHPNQETLEPDVQTMIDLRRAFEQAMYHAYTNLLPHNVGATSKQSPKKLGPDRVTSE